MEVSSSSTKSKSKGLTQKQRDILEVLKDDPAIGQIFLQNLLDNDVTGDNSSSVESATKPRIEDLQDSQGPYDLRQKQNSKGQTKEPAKVMTFGKSKGNCS